MREVGTRTPVDVLVATSHGGHLELLRAVEAAWADRSRLWLTPPSPQADELLRAGETVAHVVNPWRDPRSIARNAAQAWRVLRQARPRVVVSAGAGVAVPACGLARLLGARLVFVETMARVEGGSVSGRLVHPIADRFLVQWPELADAYGGRAEVCRPALLEEIGAPAGPGTGTFVSAGTHGRPFVRLLERVDAALRAGLLPEPVSVQADPGDWRSQRLQPVPALTPQQTRAAVERAAVVVCHGGSGLISLALRAGRTPLVLPRRAEHGEHFDDHQVGMVRKLDQLGIVVSLDDRPLDAAAVERARQAPVVPPEALAAPPLVERLRAALAA